MGEYMLRDMARKAGIADRITVASAAVSTEEIGNPIYPPARRELQKHGITVTDHRARQITQKDLEQRLIQPLFLPFLSDLGSNLHHKISGL